MTEENEVILNLREAVDITKNPKGVEKSVRLQREREKHGRFVNIPGDKSHTMIFVKKGEDAKMKIESYLNKMKNNPLKR